MVRLRGKLIEHGFLVRIDEKCVRTLFVFVTLIFMIRDHR